MNGAPKVAVFRPPAPPSLKPGIVAVARSAPVGVPPLVARIETVMFGLVAVQAEQNSSMSARVSWPLMAGVQFICAKLAKVTGRGLAGVLKKHYPPWLVYPVVISLVLANTINAGADIGAIAAAINMLVPIPIIAMIVPITATLLALQFWGSYKLIERTFKWLTLALFAYVATAFFTHPGSGEVLKGSFIPAFKFDGKFLALLTALLGTTISPYLFFWQTGQEIEEEKRIGRTRIVDREGATKREVSKSAMDVTVGMLFSNLVMYFIILTTAATLFKSGQTNIQSATDAAKALEPLAGSFALPEGLALCPQRERS